MPLSIKNLTKNSFDQSSLLAIKNAALGSKYDLSLVVCSPKEIQKLNLIYRNINKPTDILSFPLSDEQGEIHICLEEAAKEAKKFDRKENNFFLFLFIHGCAHLKGYDHGDTMEKFEEQIRASFSV